MAFFKELFNFHWHQQTVLHSGHVGIDVKLMKNNSNLRPWFRQIFFSIVNIYVFKCNPLFWRKLQNYRIQISGERGFLLYRDLKGDD